MNRIYSNLKKIALSLLVVGLAISTQAFKSNEKSKEVQFKRADGTFLAGSIVQTVANTTFQQNANPDDQNCNQTTTDYSCIYNVTPAGSTNIPDQPSYSDAEIDNYLAQTPVWLTASSGKSTVYIP